MSSALTGLTPYPIVQAPMAGGVSVPQLAGAVCEAGGLGFLAAGYKTADGMYQEIKQLRGLTGRPFGVNLFMPQPETADPAAVGVYAEQLAGEAAWYETELGDPDNGRDDNYDAKLAVLLDDPVPVVSFHFGVPAPEDLEALRRSTRSDAVVFGRQRLAAGLGACASGLVGGQLYGLAEHSGHTGGFWLIAAAQCLLLPPVLLVFRDRGTTRPAPEPRPTTTTTPATTPTTERASRTHDTDGRVPGR